MNKNQLAAAMADRTGSTQAQARKMLEALAAIVGETLAKGEDVQVIGFGKWARKFTPARTATSPTTHQQVDVPARYRPAFSAGSELKAAVNPAASE
ncbi:HU family DNA-binding protein [Streptomyces longwoodensis]|uniref:HU family DNA-binding protein n=1 Tax=Streptomyces longwoodensis TaxID=68231 RepID=UPI0036FC9FC7